MNVNQSNQSMPSEISYVSGYKVIEVNVSNNTDQLYAVVTPVKIKE
jgi:hypothetical protein